MLIEGQTAYLLHLRKYTDSRVILELLTEHHGRVSAVYRLRQRSKKTVSPQAFTPLYVDWKGNTGLKTAINVEPCGQPILLYSQSLYCALYLNELLQRVLPQEDACESVFVLYVHTLAELANPKQSADAREGCLRFFELSLLKYLGFEINFREDTDQNPIVQNKTYTYLVGEGFVYSMSGDQWEFPAHVIDAIDKRDFSDASVRKYAKYLCRMALSPLLGGRPLNSREFFR